MRTKSFFFILSFLVCFSANAQDADSYIVASGGYYFLPIASLNSQLSTMGIKKGFGNATGLGLDYGYQADEDETINGFFSYHYLLPQNISTPDNSLKFRLNGYNAQFDLGSYDWVATDNITLTGGIAWSFGRLKATENSPQGTTTFTNKYIAPEYRLEFNVRLGGFFYAGIRYAYRDDISKTGWKRSGVESVPDLTGTRLSGTMLGAFIGFGN